jgi:hypothetical protein
MTNEVTIATFTVEDETTPLRQRLEEAGIPCIVERHHWFTFDPTGGVKVRVNRQDWERARRLVNEWDRDEQILKNAIRCPDCHSFRIQYPQMSRKFVTPSIVASLLPFIRWQFYCQDCHYIWRKTKCPETKGSPDWATR